MVDLPTTWKNTNGETPTAVANQPPAKVHRGRQKERDANMARPLAAECGGGGLVPYAPQVAGHMDSHGIKYRGVLQCNNDTIFKPIIKEVQKQEIEFYTRLNSTERADLLELKKFVPQYYGRRKFTYNGHEQEYIVLENLNERMLEPCIMDVKIGRRIWHPYTPEEKMPVTERDGDSLSDRRYLVEHQYKYPCQEEFGFCIPGYQVYRLEDGKLWKYGKKQLKGLRGQAVIKAIKNFLNDSNGRLCRGLTLQILLELWKLQRWAATQTAVTLYSASLLLVYDAARLRCCCQGDDDLKCITPQPQPQPQPPAALRQSINSISPTSGSFSGHLSPKGPVYNKINSVPITAMALAQTAFTPPAPVTSPWSDALQKLTQNHSFEHNYEDKLSKMKMNYRALLDQLSEDTPNPNPWGTVKIIDFGHVFVNGVNSDDGRTIDTNFRDGLDSFVKIFEDFWKETGYASVLEV